MNLSFFIIAIIAAILVIWNTILTVMLVAVRRKQIMVKKALADEEAEISLENLIERFNVVNNGLIENNISTQEVKKTLNVCIQKVGMVRFDAFGDAGGELSSSVAFLDSEANGIVITTINGRSESRTYTKAIQDGKSSHALSEEEEKAITSAMTGRGRK